jgi:phospholipid-binding lipoprotein MlaA
MKQIILAFSLIFSINVFANNDSDPFEGVNRAIFEFNTTLDKHIFEPVAKGYKKHTPDIAQTGVSNFFSNLKEIPTFANQVLQFKLTDAMDTTMRFIFNSTIGFGGMVDVASEMGWKKRNEDFGQTLGFYGVGNGPYLVLPILGPSSLRDITIIPVDSMANIDLSLTDKQSIAKNIMFGINARANSLPQTDMVYSANDPYTTMRSSYLQNRDYLINDGEVKVDDIDF